MEYMNKEVMFKKQTYFKLKRFVLYLEEFPIYKETYYLHFYSSTKFLVCRADKFCIHMKHHLAIIALQSDRYNLLELTYFCMILWWIKW